MPADSKTHSLAKQNPFSKDSQSRSPRNRQKAGWQLSLQSYPPTFLHFITKFNISKVLREHPVFYIMKLRHYKLKKRSQRQRVSEFI